MNSRIVRTLVAVLALTVGVWCAFSGVVRERVEDARGRVTRRNLESLLIEISARADLLVRQPEVIAAALTDPTSLNLAELSRNVAGPVAFLTTTGLSASSTSGVQASDDYVTSSARWALNDYSPFKMHRGGLEEFGCSANARPLPLRVLFGEPEAAQTQETRPQGTVTCAQAGEGYRRSGYFSKDERIYYTLWTAPGSKEVQNLMVYRSLSVGNELQGVLAMDASQLARWAKLQYTPRCENYGYARAVTAVPLLLLSFFLVGALPKKADEKRVVP